MINDYIVEVRCPICESIEIQNHITKYSQIRSVRKEFVKNLVAKVVENKLEDIILNIIMSFAKDIVVYLENRDEDEYEMNQQYIRIKELFCGYIVRDWEGADVNTRK